MDDRQELAGLVRELFAVYEGIRNGAPPALQTPRPYREHIEWLEKELSSKNDAARALVSSRRPDLKRWCR